MVNLVLNYIFIPKYSAVGASIATLFAEISVCIIQTSAVRKELTIISYIKSFIPFLIGGILMFVTLTIIGNKLIISIPNLLIMIAIGGLIYSIITITILAFTKDNMFIGYYNSFKNKMRKTEVK